MSEAPSLKTRLHRARVLLLEQRRILYDSEAIRTGGPDHGSVTPDIQRELARYDDARAAITAAMKLLT